MLRSVGRRVASSVVRRELTSAARVAVVGSGPSGFYTAKYLLKADDKMRVTMLERWPTPYGLVRFGVAPDHPEESKLGVPGEDLRGVLSARRFVAWYNSEPTSASLAPLAHLKTTPGGQAPSSFDAVVVGHGNVGLDAARFLASRRDRLAETDVSRAALDAVDGLPRRREVTIVGRRGATQAAFTIKELRELTKLADVRLVVSKAELDAGDTAASAAEATASRALKRKRDLLEQHCAEPLAEGTNVHLRFLLNPVEFKSHAEDPTRVGSVVLERCTLEGPEGEQRARGTGDFEELKCDAAFVAVGYVTRTPTLDDGRTLPTAGRSKALVHAGGRVEGVEGLYCAGWVKRGPSGIIGSNIADAKETVSTLVNDLSQQREPAAGAAADTLVEFLASAETTTTWADWETINAREREAGAAVGAPRLKLADVDQMLSALGR